MRKYTLIKFFKGEATESEMDSIAEWINRSPRNMEYFARQKAIYTAIESVRLKQEPTPATEIPLKKRNHIPVAKYIAAAVVASVCFLAGLWINNSSHKADNQTQLISQSNSSTPIKHSLYTEKGVKGFITLPDSSKVWLNSDSRITYPDEFTGEKRIVSISGEAYFEVMKDSLHPMIVLTNKDFMVEVLGTTFNIRSYEDDATAETTLYTGKIKMHYKDRKSSKIRTADLKPNDSFTYADKSNTHQQTTDAKPEIKKAWKEGSLIFDNTSMEDVIKRLERWHGTNFIVNNRNIYDRKLSATFTSESIVQIMEIIQMIMPITYSYNNNTVTIN